MEKALGIQELVDACISHIYDDRQSLKSASMVNRTFHASCAPHFFRSITLRLGRKVSRVDIAGPSGRLLPLYHLLNASPHIGRLVQELRIHGNFSDFPQTVGEPQDTYLDHVLGALSSLSSIEFQHLGLNPGSRLKLFGEWDSLPSSLTKSFNALLKSPNLHTVQFKNLIGTPIHSLRSSRGIKTLRMVWSPPSTPDYTNDVDLTVTSTDRPQINSLSYIHHALTQPPISQFLEPNSPLDLSNLKTFNVFIGIGTLQEQGALWDFLLPIKASIEHLGLRPWQDLVGTVPDPLDLGKFESLRSLHLACGVTSHIHHPLAWFNHQLGKFVSSNHIKEITLTLRFRPEVVRPFLDLSRPAWEEMDRIIANASLPFLQAFNVHFHERDVHGNLLTNNEHLKAEIPHRMSRLQGSGILSVKFVTVMPLGLAYIDNE